MIEGTTRAASAGARGYGLGNAVIDCESDRGHRGTCRIDGEGRVYEVKVTAFPHWDNPSWQSSYSVTCESKKNRREAWSWGQVGSTLWVDRGCRGLFEVSPLASSGGDDLTRRAISSCRSKVEQQGFTYRRTGTVQNVGRHIEVDVSAGRGSVEINLRCRFDPVFGTVDLASY